MKTQFQKVSMCFFQFVSLLSAASCAHQTDVASGLKDYNRIPASAVKPQEAADNLKSFPLFSVVKDDKGSEFIISHKQAIAEFLDQKAKKSTVKSRDLVRSALRAPQGIEMVNVFAETLLEKSLDPLGNFSCFMDDQSWDEALEVLGDWPIYNGAAIKKRLAATLIAKDCKISQPLPHASIGIPEVEAPSLDGIATTSIARLVDSLLYVATTVGKEKVLFKTSTSTISLVGNLYAISFEDMSQSDHKGNFATLTHEYGAEIGFRLDAPHKTSLAVMAYAYAVGDAFPHEQDRFTEGEEFYISLYKDFGTRFRAGVEY